MVYFVTVIYKHVLSAKKVQAFGLGILLCNTHSTLLLMLTFEIFVNG